MTPFEIHLSSGSSGDWLPIVLPVYGLVWLFVLAVILHRPDFDPVTRLTWVIVVLFVPVFGILLYWAIAPGSVTKRIDNSNPLSGTPWENNPSYTSKSKQT